MRERPIITGAPIGKHPPESPVPAPRGTKRTSWRRHARTIAATSAVERGSTTTSGRERSKRVAVALVDRQLFAAAHEPAVAYDRRELVDERRGHRHRDDS